jgi:uncharacterized protein
MPEYKTLPQLTKSIADRTVTGIFAVHGNVDDGGDRSHPGAFADSSIKGRDRAAFLWMHDAYAPPTATIDSIRELSKTELPDAVRGFAPDATGAAEVTRTYLETPRGNEILAGLKAGAIDEMSYAYDVAEHSDTTDESGKTVRELYKLRLWDISDVTHGMNPATLGSKAIWKDRPLVEQAHAVETAIADLVERIQDVKAGRAKQGRVFSASNYAALESVAGELATLEARMRDLLSSAEPKANIDMRLLLVEYQRTIAQLNGVLL